MESVLGKQLTCTPPLNRLFARQLTCEDTSWSAIDFSGASCEEPGGLVQHGQAKKSEVESEGKWQGGLGALSLKPSLVRVAKWKVYYVSEQAERQLAAGQEVKSSICDGCTPCKLLKAWSAI